MNNLSCHIDSSLLMQVDAENQHKLLTVLTDFKMCVFSPEKLEVVEMDCVWCCP